MAGWLRENAATLALLGIVNVTLLRRVASSERWAASVGLSARKPGDGLINLWRSQHAPLWWTDGVGQAVPSHFRLRRT